MTGGTEKCWPWKGTWGGRDRDKRPYFHCEGARWLAYRLVFVLATGTTLSTEQHILHDCDAGSWPTGCCNPKHLRASNNRTNVDDRLLRERHGLSHAVVKNIRRLLQAGKQTQADIAELYGISREAVSAIATQRTYAHVKDDLNE